MKILTERKWHKQKMEWIARGWKDASKEVRNHWNQSSDMVNAKDQAARSADVLEKIARELYIQAE